MKLFDELVRTDMRAKLQNEPSFSYQNQSARPMVVAIRKLLESWFSEFPRDEQHDLRQRFRQKREDQHLAAFTELYLHELMRRLQYDLVVHPSLVNAPTHPDFFATAEGKGSFYLEAKVTMSPKEQSVDRRLHAVYDEINKVPSPNFFLHLDYAGEATDNLNGKAIRAQIRRWIEGLDYEQVQRDFDSGGYSNLPTLQITESGLEMTFSASPKGENTRGKNDVPTIGMLKPDGIWELNTHTSIRSALEDKAKKYGELQHPFVVVVNVMDIFCDQSSIWAALLGDEQVVATRRADGTWKHEWGSRLPNGLWRGPRGPRNQQVSAVVVIDCLIPTTLRKAKIEVIHNPWAEKPLRINALPLPYWSPYEGTLQKMHGTEAADILEIPKPWPARED